MWQVHCQSAQSPTSYQNQTVKNNLINELRSLQKDASLHDSAPSPLVFGLIKPIVPTFVYVIRVYVDYYIILK